MANNLIYGLFKRRLWLDLETRNTIDINTPTYVETAEILLFIWAIGDGDVQVWDSYHDPQMPARLLDALTDPDTVVTHFNGRSFDMRVIRHALSIDVEPERQDDIKETALRYNLPASLAKLGAAVGVAEDDAKDKRGAFWIDMFCIPLADKLLKPGSRYPENAPVSKYVLTMYAAETGKTWCDPDDFPIEYAYFKRYGKQDVHTMRVIYNSLPKWNDTYRELMQCAVNHRINERGLRIDMVLAERMTGFVKKSVDKVTRKIMLMTSGVSPRSHKKYKAWLQQQMPGVVVKGTGKPEIEMLRKEHTLPDIVEKVFALQAQATSNSLKKFPKALELAHPKDHRVRFPINIRGAGTTGRYGAAGGLQVHNFPRPTVAPDEIKTFLDDVLLRQIYRETLLAAAPSLLRPMIIPSEGCRFRNADLSSIEGRMMAWQSGFTQQVEDYANGVNAYFSNGPIFGYTYDEIKAYKKSHIPDEYNIYMLCKVMELALIYQGGVSALCGMGAIYGLNMPQLADMLLRKQLVTAAHLFSAKKALAYIRLTKKGRASVASTKLQDLQWMALDAAKRAWRERHGPVVAFWDIIQRNMLAAFANPGRSFDFGYQNRISMCYLADIGWFGIKLASGRVLSYYGARLGGASEAGYDEDDEDIEEEKDERLVLLYHTFDKNGMVSKRPKVAHAGMLANNITQGNAASLLDDILYDMDYEKWNPVFHVHDQAISDLPITDPRTPEDLENLLCRERDWCPGLPLGAEGEYLDRFAK